MRSRRRTNWCGNFETGWDERDADISDRHFAADVLWDSPFGATMSGYDDLHAIHVRLKKEGRGGPSSHYEVVQVLAPTPGVAIARSAALALDADGEAPPSKRPLRSRARFRRGRSTCSSAGARHGAGCWPEHSPATDAGNIDDVVSVTHRLNQGSQSRKRNGG